MSYTTAMTATSVTTTTAMSSGDDNAKRRGLGRRTGAQNADAFRAPGMFFFYIFAILIAIYNRLPLPPHTRTDCRRMTDSQPHHPLPQANEAQTTIYFANESFRYYLSYVNKPDSRIMKDRERKGRDEEKWGPGV